jgi:predicted nucleic acid-binding protein
MNIVDTSGYKLAMADSLIYASAKVANAIVWTQDKDFEGLPGVKYIRNNITAKDRHYPEIWYGYRYREA